MPFKAEISNKSMADIAELRKRNKMAIKQLQTTGKTAVTRMLAFMSGKFADEWEKEAPRLTGTLALSTRGEVDEGRGTGQVFIDPSNINPILGGKPSVYGPVVHERNPWVTRVYTSKTPKIVSEGADMIWEAMNEIYNQ